MSVSPKTQVWIDWVLVTSIPLCHFDESKAPDNFASGCLIEYRNKRFLFSVCHAIDRTSDGWMAYNGFEPGKGSVWYPLGLFNYVSEIAIGSRIFKEIDFCFTEVSENFLPLFQYHTFQALSDERPRHVFQTDLSALPSDDQIFGFSGKVEPEAHGLNAVITTAVVYPGLRFLRTESEYHVFQLPVPHPGHKLFQGCSGAPIVDMNKNVVALVCDGDSESNTIRGVSLARYKSALEFFCNQVA